jgi:phosphoglycolate phosphatase
MNVIFDLDGTLIDARMRLYRLFQQLVPESQLSLAQYWEMKRNGISNQEILATDFGFDAAATSSFVADWMALIEAPEFLALDELFPRVPEALALLQLQARLYVCTARQDRDAALGQLERLGLVEFFEQILVTEQRESKESLIRRDVAGLHHRDWILGDTGKDVQVGNALEINTCAVLSGFRNRTTLAKYGPDLVLNSAADFLLG